MKQLDHCLTHDDLTRVTGGERVIISRDMVTPGVNMKSPWDPAGWAQAGAWWGKVWMGKIPPF